MCLFLSSPQVFALASFYGKLRKCIVFENAFEKSQIKRVSQQKMCFAASHQIGVNNHEELLSLGTFLCLPVLPFPAFSTPLSCSTLTFLVSYCLPFFGGSFQFVFGRNRGRVFQVNVSIFGIALVDHTRCRE